MKYIRNALLGFFMGCAEMVPGVSGSTIALVGGIYEGIIELLYTLTVISKVVAKFFLRKASLKDIWAEILKIDIKFVIPLGIGFLVALITMSSAVLWLLQYYPHYLLTGLLALLLSAAVIPYMEMDRKGVQEAVVFTITFLLFLFIMTREDGINSDPSYLLLLLGGFFGISGLILPGVSGGVILLVMGVYYYVIDAVHSIITFSASADQLIGMMLFGVGAIVGVYFISITIRKLLVRSRSLLMAFIMGLVLSSTPQLLPFVETTGFSEGGNPVVEYVGISNFTDSELIAMVVIFTVVLLAAVSFNLRSYRKDHKAKVQKGEKKIVSA